MEAPTAPEPTTGGADLVSDLVLGRLGVLVGCVVALAGIVVWWVFLGRKRLIQDVPTSSTHGVTLGLNEVIGRVECDQSVPSPEAAVECVWWKHEYFVADGDSGWRKTGEKVGGPVSFRLVDEAGEIEVRPRHAEVHGPTSYEGPRSATSLFGPDPNPTLASRHIAARAMGSTKKTRMIETTIPVGADVYVLGTAQLPHDSLEPHLGPDAEGRDPFLVRVGTEADAVFRERVGAILGFVMTLTGLVGAGLSWRDGDAIAAGTMTWRSIDPVGPVLGGAVTLAVMTVLSAVFTYNGLIRLRQRAQAAWSLIDVQLRRRHDLIPALAAVVEAHARHEIEVQHAVAELRASVMAPLPTEPTDDAVAVADRSMRAGTSDLVRLLALAERHPTLTADASFAGLRAALVDTEDRIALARGFYNASVQTLHDRAGAVPGNLVAWVFELDLRAAFTDERDPQLPAMTHPAAVRFPTGLRPAALARRMRA